MTPDELSADMKAVVSEWLDMAQREPSTISTIRGVPVCQTEIDYLRALLKAYQEQRRALEAASPFVPVGMRQRVLDELDKAWLHGQRRTSWRRDESADAILAALRQPVVPVGVSREDIARLLHAIVDSDGTLVRVEEAVDAILAALRPTDTGRG
jgi:hypothetical protein